MAVDGGCVQPSREAAEVSGIRYVPDADLPDFPYLATSQPGAPTLETAYDIVVDATGFCAMSFSELMDDSAKASLLAHLEKAVPDLECLKRDARDDPARDLAERGLMSRTAELIATNAIQRDLSVTDFLPRLHLPMLADLQQGPGFPNLTSLGLLSDGIWASYCRH